MTLGTRWLQDRWLRGQRSSNNRGNISLRSFRSILGPTHPPIQYILGANLNAVKKEKLSHSCWDQPQIPWLSSLKPLVKPKQATQVSLYWKSFEDIKEFLLLGLF